MQKLTGQYKRTLFDNHQERSMDNPTREGGNRPCIPCRKGQRPAVFFDVDGTLVQGDTQEMEARYLLKKSRFSLSYLWSIILTLAAIQFNRLGWISLSLQNEIYIKSYRGRSWKELVCHARNLFEQLVSKQFFPNSLEILEKHRQQGYLIVLVSATTRHLLIPFKEIIQPDRIFCTDLELDAKGICTGHASGKICAEKEKVIRVQKFAGLHRIDLASSYAYSDHHSDIPFLSCVGNPAVINPTGKLAAHAGRKGWPVHKFSTAGEQALTKKR